MIIVSLASIPFRFESLKKTIISLNLQTVKPNIILLNICKQYKRLKETWKDEDIEELKKYDNLIINWCNDEGPGTKILGIPNNNINISKEPEPGNGSLLNFPEDNKIIILDDDMEYHNKTIEILLQNINEKMISTFNYFNNTDFIEQSDGYVIKSNYIYAKLPGYLGYCFYQKYLTKLKEFMRSLYIIYPDVIYDDDAAVTGFFRSNKFKIIWNKKLDFIPNELHYNEKALSSIHDYSSIRLTIIPRYVQEYINNSIL